MYQVWSLSQKICDNEQKKSLSYIGSMKEVILNNFSYSSRGLWYFETLSIGKVVLIIFIFTPYKMLCR